MRLRGWRTLCAKSGKARRRKEWTLIAFPEARRRGHCEQAGQLLGLDSASIEKDLWVCWTLRELFALPDIGPHLTFKGGTSLSKGWKLIERLSEDIDVVIDRAFLGFGETFRPKRAEQQAAPSAAGGPKGHLSADN